MIHNTRNNFCVGLITPVVIVTALLLLGAAVAGGQGRVATKSAHISAPQQPLYSEYRGVRIGMSTAEVRTKLGAAQQPGDDMDFYAFSEKEAAQIVYDTAHVVKTISVDYVGGVGAPDYKAVVGPDVEVRADDRCTSKCTTTVLVSGYFTTVAPATQQPSPSRSRRVL